MSDNIPLFEIDWGRDDVRNVVDSVTRGGHWAKGPYIRLFEERIEEYLGVNHARVVNSGTTALVCALKAHGIGPGDEVIVPPFTFIATANAVELVGAKPVFADIERQSLGLDPATAQRVVTEDTAAILPVHVYGGTFALGEFRDLADDHGVALIEDAAAALGATHNGVNAGTIGDSACFSFCQNKIVATGEGGAVVTDDVDMANRIELFRSHGRITEGDYFHSAEGSRYVTIGSNYRMPDIVAALGCAQIKRIETIIEKRRRVADLLTREFEDIPKVDAQTGGERGRHVYQIYTLLLAKSVDRQNVIETLADRGIASKIYWDPIHLSDHYQETYGYELGDFPVAESVTDRVLSLPIHPNQSPGDCRRITRAVQKAVEQ